MAGTRGAGWKGEEEETLLYCRQGWGHAGEDCHDKTGMLTAESSTML